jgi:hypothetical protein
MQSPQDTYGKRRWPRALTAIPLPLRILAVIWLFLSIAFNIGLPGSTANLPPLASFLILLPMAILSIALGLFIFWCGFKTIYAAVLSVRSPKVDASTPKSHSFYFVGGMGALQIYLIVYMLAAFWLAKASGNYGASVGLSAILVAGISYALVARKPHPKDVKVFLIGGLLITILFGLIMATVAVPLT